MIAQANLKSSMSALGTTLERLSTGLRINSGKDDPAGLIASEVLRSEIAGIKQGITNTERANMMIATADSAMNEISNLLNDIRGLISEAANTGAMSREMIEANQMQVDASLEAIDRIAASTTFMGRKLLDGSLDFTTDGVDRKTLQNLAITKATFGTSDQVSINIQVREAAQRAELYYNHAVAMEDVTLVVRGSRGGSPFTFAKGTTVREMAEAINLESDSTGVIAEVGRDATYGSMLVSSVGDHNDIIVTAGAAGAQAGFVEIKYTIGNEKGVYVAYEESLGPGYPAVFNVYLQTEAWHNATAKGIDSDSLFNNNALDFVANIPGAQYNNVSIHYVDGNLTDANFNTSGNTTGTAGNPYAYYNDTSTQARALVGDVNGLAGFVNGPANAYMELVATQGGSQNNDVTIQFIHAPGILPPGFNALARYEDNPEMPGKKVLNVYVDAGNTTFEEIKAAIDLDGTFKCHLNDLDAQTIETADCHVVGGAVGVQGNTNYSGGDAGTLFVVARTETSDPGNGHTANEIRAIFDLSNLASRGSERAAAMFTVTRSIDNDGTGAITSKSFKNVFSGGVTGGSIITTAEEVVAALNNDKLWNGYIDKTTLAGLIDGSIGPFYSDGIPIVTAEVAPGNTGKGVVSPFQEVAYFGCPYDGTGIQFLGPTGSRNIRFVAEKNNPELSIDYESIPDKLDYSMAILNSTNPHANVTVTARNKGSNYDDITFRIKHAPPYFDGGVATQHVNGWAEYDNGLSAAETLIQFHDTDGNFMLNTAFYLTANERGDEFNNVSVQLAYDMNQVDDIVVSYNESKKIFQISLRDPTTTTTNAIIAAVNAPGENGKSKSGFHATLAFGTNYDGMDRDINNNGTGTFGSIGLALKKPIVIGNTGNTGGHAGTVTVYMVDESTGSPTAQQLVEIINNDDIVGHMFTARNYSTGGSSGTGLLDFTQDTNFQTGGGIAEEGVIVVHLQTDANGLIVTTARDLVEFWSSLPPEYTSGISASLLREPGAMWDICNDTDGRGILPATPASEECEVVTYYDIAFQAWADDPDYTYDSIAKFAQGTMTAVNGQDASYVLKARKPGDTYNGYVINYIDDPNVTGKYADNVEINNTLFHNGLAVEIDGKNINIYLREGVTTANDIKQLIENDPLTKTLFEVILSGTGDKGVTLQDNSLVTTGGIAPPGGLNGAKLLGGLDEDEFGIRFMSEGYGTDALVEVIAKEGNFELKNSGGKVTEKNYGKDIDALLNGVQMVSYGLNVSINTSTIGLSLTFAEGTEAGYWTSFDITGGGATFQLGPAVTTNQQITIGIQSLNTISLGGVSGKLFQLKSGQDAALAKNTRLAYRIVEEAIVQVTTLRGRFGAIQRATFETNINVLNDTLQAMTSAESQIRDADFAEETSNLTRHQILVQSGVRTLGITNQLPQYILGLLQ